MLAKSTWRQLPWPTNNGCSEVAPGAPQNVTSHTEGRTGQTSAPTDHLMHTRSDIELANIGPGYVHLRLAVEFAN